MQQRTEDFTPSAVEKSVTENERLSDKKVSDLIVDKKRLVEVPYTASLAHTMNSLVANQVVAVPVAAPPGHWIGAGGSMIMESDKQTGVVRKHYIGMATMLDILAHIAGDDAVDGGEDDASDLDKKMSVPVSSIIGHCLEGLSLWTLNPNTSQMENISGVELMESASSYRMLTQMDLLKFMMDLPSELRLRGIKSRSVAETGAINENVYAVSGRTKVIDAIKCMRAALLNAVPIVVASISFEEDSKQLINGKGKQLIGTFSATDLGGCHLVALRTWLPLSALEFTESVSSSPIYAASNASNILPRELVTCTPESSLYDVIDKEGYKACAPSLGCGSTGFSYWTCFSGGYYQSDKGFATCLILPSHIYICMYACDLDR